jgi:hypothetical protein
MRYVIVALVFTCLFAGAAAAQVTNGSFTSGLAGWGTAVTGFGTVGPDAYGAPANSARLTTNGSLLAFPVGTASLTQSFGCGSSFENGACAMSLDYFFSNMASASARITVSVDGNPVYTADHGANLSAFIPVTFTAGCGLHNLAVDVTYLSGGAVSGWAFWIDNVTAECVQDVVPVDASSWGTIKAWYR